MKAKDTVLSEVTFRDGIVITVHQGKLSKLDFVVKYKLPVKGARERAPKHIHWAVDVLLKKQGNPQLTSQLLDYLLTAWANTQPLQTRAQREQFFLRLKSGYPRKFKTLDQYGYFKVEFLITLARLLMRQEKTNRPDAYMFRKVLESLRNPNEKDLFKLISTATLARNRKH